MKIVNFLVIFGLLVLFTAGCTEQYTVNQSPPPAGQTNNGMQYIDSSNTQTSHPQPVSPATPPPSV